MKYLAFCKKTKQVIGSIRCINIRPYYIPCPTCGPKQKITWVRQLNGGHVQYKHFFVGAKQRHFLDKLTNMGYDVVEECLTVKV